MALQRTPSSTEPLPIVGQVPNHPGKTLIFCNGLMNELDGAKASAGVISDAFGGRQVFVYHNPTDINAYFDSNIEQFERQIDLSVSLAHIIHNSISSDRERGIDERQICVTLFVHSHGAVVAEKALFGISALDETDKDKIRVYAFGGATILPNRLASTVQNYVFDEDLIADFANLKPSEKMVLYKTKQITKVMMEEGVALQIAIINQAYKDLHFELHPLSRSSHVENAQSRREYDQRYRQIFVQNDLHALSLDPYFFVRIREYIACFRDYNVIILEGAPFQHPEYSEIQRHSNVREALDNLPKNLASILGNAFKGLAALGSHALTNHLFSAYGPVIEDIARQETEM